LTCADAESGQILDRCSRCRFVRVVPPRFLPHSLPHTNRCARCASTRAAIAAMRRRGRSYSSCCSRMEGMILHVVGQGFVCQRGDLRWNLTERGPRGFGTTPTGASPLKRQNSAIPIPSGNTIVAVPDGQLGRRLIGVEYLRQGWGRNCTDTARGSRTVSDQPTRGPLTRAHWAGPIGTWRPGPDERRSVCKTGGCGSSPSSTPSAAADGGR
jgi:hypothetical protein